MALALLGLLLTIFQCWYVYLPHEEAALIDLCRFNSAIDCFRSLNAYGESMAPWGLPVFPVLASLYFLQTMLLAFSGVERGEARESWLVIGRLLSFPASGLAIYVILHDILVAKATSASAILVVMTSLTLSAFAILHGLPRARMAAGGARALVLVLVAVLFGYFVHGAGDSRMEAARIRRERAAEPPQLILPRFALRMPRRGAASAGEERASCEVLLFVDLGGERGRALARAAHRAATSSGGRLRVVLYAQGAFGRGLVRAQAEDSLEAYLAQPTEAGASDLPDDAHPALTDPSEWSRRAGVEELPCLLWEDGRASGPALDLEDALRRACGP